MLSTLNADNYRLNIPAISKLTQSLTSTQRVAFCGKLAIMTGVPIVVIGFYIAELYGIDDELSDFIKKMMNFYQIGTVLNTHVSLV